MNKYNISFDSDYCYLSCDGDYVATFNNSDWLSTVLYALMKVDKIEEEDLKANWDKEVYLEVKVKVAEIKCEGV